MTTDNKQRQNFIEWRERNYLTTDFTPNGRGGFENSVVQAQWRSWQGCFELFEQELK